MFTRLLVCSFAILSGTTTLFAQWEWVDNSQGSANLEHVTDVAVDDIRDVVYSVGYITGSPNFSEIPNSSYNGGRDGFIMKYDLTGNVLWGFAIGGDGDDKITGVDVDDLTGNIYVTGHITGSYASNYSTFEGALPGATSNVTGSNGSEDAFVAMYSVLGELVWYRLIGGPDRDRGMDVSVNSSGVFMNGFYTNSSPLSILSTVVPFSGEINNFVVGLDLASGNNLWTANLGSGVDDYTIDDNSSEIRRMGITTDSTDVYVVTYKRGLNYNVYDAAGQLSATLSDPNEDFAVTSYSNAGNHNWSVLYDNGGNQAFGLDITNDCSGVYVTGTMHDGGVTPGGGIINAGHDDILLSKLSKPNGNELWWRQINTAFNHDAYFVGIDADNYGNLYAIGRLRGTSASSGTDFNLTGRPSHSEVIIANYFTDGSFRSFEAIPSSQYSWGMSIGTYKNEKYVVGGYYNDNITFGSISPSNNVDNAFIAMRGLADPVVYTSAVSNGSSFCQIEANPVPSLNAPSGGTFSGPAQVVFADASTGEIDLSSSIVGGPYTITYSGFGLGCAVSSYSTQIWINPVDDASFTYSTNTFCTSDPNPSPTSIATSGGSFSASGGLIFANTSTGEIDLSASSIGGPYNVIYTTGTGVCSSSDTVQIFISGIPDASFGYSSSNFCIGTGTISPTFTVTSGGTFLAPAGLVFSNSTTGEIDLNSSTSGSYTISYTVGTGNCANSSTFSVVLTDPEDASFSYSNTSLCSNDPNAFPSNIATTGGVFFAPSGLIVTNASTGEIGSSISTVGGPYQLFYTTSGSVCPGTDSLEFYIEAAPNASFAYGQTSYCEQSGTILPSSVATAGGTFSGPSEIVFTNIATGEIDLNASTPGGPFTIEYSVSSGSCQDVSTFDLTIFPLSDASFSFANSTYCSNEVNPVPSSIVAGGGTFSASTGIVLANVSTGEIDVSSSTTGSPYFVVYTTTNASCPTSDSLAITIENAPDPTFSYAQSSYCSGTGSILPNAITTAGGIFSAPAGIVFADIFTGEIDLGASSTGGPYTIQYSISTTYCQESSTFDLTINQTEDAGFSYGGNYFCYNEPNPTPSTINTPGGTFSGPTDLVVNSATGEIDVVNSTVGGPYYLVYTTNGGICSSSDSIQIYIEPSPDPSFGYAQTSYCEGTGIVSPSFIVTTGGTFSAPAEIVFSNIGTGEIDISASQVGGPYTIQHLVTNTYCQKSTTFNITIIGQDNLNSMSYASNDFCVSEENQLPSIDGISGGVFSGPTSIGLISTSSGEFSPSSSNIGGPYTIQYVTSGTCPDSAEFDVSIFDLPTAYAGEDQELYFVLNSTLEADFPSVGSGIWTTSSPALVEDEFNPNSTVSNLNKGENAFLWTVSNGVCPAVSDELIIDVGDLYIPQAVTPNDDGKNDYFTLRSLDEVTCSLKIFNRWGQIVYDNSNYQNDWYGQNAKGKQLENDTYFYVILIDDSITYNGYVILKK